MRRMDTMVDSALDLRYANRYFVAWMSEIRKVTIVLSVIISWRAVVLAVS